MSVGGNKPKLLSINLSNLGIITETYYYGNGNIELIIINETSNTKFLGITIEKHLSSMGQMVFRYKFGLYERDLANILCVYTYQ